VAFLFKKNTVTGSIFKWQYENMPGIERTNLNKNKTPEVTFSIELHPATPEQIEAGKRLFLRLIERARNKQEIK
jgi:hypothetical protein